MIKKLNEKICNSTFLKNDSSIKKSFLIIAFILSIVFIFVFLFSFFITDLSEEYNRMDNVMQNNKTEIVKYLSLNKDCIIYDVEEGYNVSINNDTISIISNKTPYLIEITTNPKIRYSVDRVDNDFVISKTYQEETVSSMPIVLIKNSALGVCCGFFSAMPTIMLVAFIYFVIICPFIKFLYARQLEKLKIKENNAV